MGNSLNTEPLTRPPQAASAVSHTATPRHSRPHAPGSSRKMKMNKVSMNLKTGILGQAPSFFFGLGVGGGKPYTGGLYRNLVEV